MHIYWSERMLGSGGSFASSQPGTLVEQPTQFSNHQPASSISLLEQEKILIVLSLGPTLGQWSQRPAKGQNEQRVGLGVRTCSRAALHLALCNPVSPSVFLVSTDATRKVSLASLFCVFWKDIKHLAEGEKKREKGEGKKGHGVRRMYDYRKKGKRRLIHQESP